MQAVDGINRQTERQRDAAMPLPSCCHYPKATYYCLLYATPTRKTCLFHQCTDLLQHQHSVHLPGLSAVRYLTGTWLQYSTVLHVFTHAAGDGDS